MSDTPTPRPEDALPRPEYPRPQFVRADWLCLNGPWQFEFDSGDSGRERGLLRRELSGTIMVPFCPESLLSGVADPDFHPAVWYRRDVTIPADWGDSRVLLHFQAIDYDATVWVVSAATKAQSAAILAKVTAMKVKAEAAKAAALPVMGKDPDDRTPDDDILAGQSAFYAAAYLAAQQAAKAALPLGEAVEVGRHRGGFTPLTCDLGAWVTAGETVTVYVRARDDNRTPKPAGKQASSYAPNGCFYTRTTGIWQTVWMEPVPRAAALGRPRITPDVGAGAFQVALPITQNRPGFRVRVTLKDADGVLVTAHARADIDRTPHVTLSIPAEKQRLWSPRDPFLYDLDIELIDMTGAVIDKLAAYAGLRAIALDGKKVKINGEVIFQRLVLDQGYYPDGVMTAPSDAALIADIELSMAVGFNGARLHQKVFEERFLYHADRLGYLVWGEFADWGGSGFGPSHDHQQPGATFITQWLEACARDYSHPAIIGWCGLNETWQTLHDRVTVLDDVTRAMYLAAKALDTTRPVLDASGYAHRVPETEVYDSHDYIVDNRFAEGLEKMRLRHRGIAEGDVFVNLHDRQAESLPYAGQPYFVSEFGGFKWNPDRPAKTAAENALNPKDSWGYGSDPANLEDFYQRFQAVCDLLLDQPEMFGYCYTQLTDVFPEENGLYTFDRRAKFDAARLRAIQSRRAAIEESPGGD